MMSISLYVLSLSTTAFLTLPALLHAITYRGFVNPLEYASKEQRPDGEWEIVYTAFNNLEDGGSQTAIIDAVKHHTEILGDGSLAALQKANRRKFLVGSTDCNCTIDTESYREHAELLEEHGMELTRTFINIGAANGEDEDPTWEFAREFSGRGVYFEKDAKQCAALSEKLAPISPQSIVICNEVTPMNIVSLLKEHVPSVQRGQRHFDLIKVDIDSFDGAIIEALLREHFTAKHLFLEVNPAVPPPYQFATQYHPKLFEVMIGADKNATASVGSSGGDSSVATPQTAIISESSSERQKHVKKSSQSRAYAQHWPLRGMSLSYAVNLVSKYGYDFVNFKYHDAVFVHRNYRQIYGFAPPYDEFDCYHKSFVMSNGVPIEKTRKWFYEMSNEKAQGEIFQYMVRHSLTASGGKYAFPFHLSY